MYAFVLLYHENVTDVKISWKTTNELNIVGFNLYKYDSPENHPILITDKIIPVLSDPLIGGDYQFIDKKVKPGDYYRYRLEEIEENGRVNVLGDIQVLARDYRPIEIITSITLITIGLFGLWLFRKK